MGLTAMDTNPGWSDTQKMLALSVVGAFIITITLWMFFPPKGDPGSIAVLNTLVGALGSGFGMVLTYFFGSSKSSSDKDQTIKNTLDTTVAKTTGSNGAAVAPVSTTTTTTATPEKVVTTTAPTGPAP